ncbi:hypothetical protein ABZ746_15965 [Streptomyces sp. NPDC020096]
MLSREDEGREIEDDQRTTADSRQPFDGYRLPLWLVIIPMIPATMKAAMISTAMCAGAVGAAIHMTLTVLSLSVEGLFPGIDESVGGGL